MAPEASFGKGCRMSDSLVLLRTIPIQFLEAYNRGFITLSRNNLYMQGKLVGQLTEAGRRGLADRGVHLARAFLPTSASALVSFVGLAVLLSELTKLSRQVERGFSEVDRQLKALDAKLDLKIRRDDDYRLAAVQAEMEALVHALRENDWSAAEGALKQLRLAAIDRERLIAGIPVLDRVCVGAVLQKEIIGLALASAHAALHFGRHERAAPDLLKAKDWLTEWVSGTKRELQRVADNPRYQPSFAFFPSMPLYPNETVEAATKALESFSKVEGEAEVLHQWLDALAAEAEAAKALGVLPEYLVRAVETGTQVLLLPSAAHQLGLPIGKLVS